MQFPPEFSNHDAIASDPELAEIVTAIKARANLLDAMATLLAQEAEKLAISRQSLEGQIDAVADIIRGALHLAKPAASNAESAHTDDRPPVDTIRLHIAAACLLYHFQNLHPGEDGLATTTVRNLQRVWGSSLPLRDACYALDDMGILNVTEAYGPNSEVNCTYVSPVIGARFDDAFPEYDTASPMAIKGNSTRILKLLESLFEGPRRLADLLPRYEQEVADVLDSGACCLRVERPNGRRIVWLEMCPIKAAQ